MDKLKAGAYIANIDAKDIFLSNHLINPQNDSKGRSTGYSLKYRIGEHKGEWNFRRFGAKLDYSLDLIKMQEVDQRVRNAGNFIFESDGKSYSIHVINVTFKYSIKQFNRTGANTYVKFGYSPETLVFQDSVALIDGELIGITLNETINRPISDDVLGQYFCYQNGTYQRTKKVIPVLHKIDEIRKDIYKSGFYCDGIHYVRYKRSAGSSRVGNCLFINEKLYSQMMKWSLCGLTIRKGQAVDLAALEAYISLTLSSIIDTIQIRPENILVIEDYKSVFKDHAVATRFVDGHLHSSPDEVEISNSIWDGQSLMDRSVFLQFQEQQRKNNPDAKEYGMLLLRARFFKSCCFNANIQQWFADNGVSNVNQLNGKTRAKQLEDIKLITTPSSIKYLKFGTLEKWLDMLDQTVGVVKHEKPTHFFDGRMVQTHYQLLNTLQMTYDEVENLVKPSLDFMSMVKIDPAAFRYYINYQCCDPYDEYYSRTIKSKNDIISTMLGVSDRFAKTKLYHEFVKSAIDSFKKNLRCGHILVHGNYSVLCGNPIEMLKQAIGKFDGKSAIQPNTVHSTYFADGQELLGSRSPHVTMGNVLVTRNIRSGEISRYMNPTPEILFVNSINENLLERLSGADFDSDSIMLTDNAIMLQAAKRNYNHFPVPTKLVEAINLERYYTDDDKADLDLKTSINKIGEIINLSQELNSILWDRLYHGAEIEDVMGLYCDIAQLDVMSNLEIDSAKRENPANNTAELKTIKEKYDLRDKNKRHIRPLFFKYIDDYKGYREGYYVYFDDDGESVKIDVVGTFKEAQEIQSDNEDIQIEKGRMTYQSHKTSMDYLERCIDNYKMPRQSQKDLLDFADCLIAADEVGGQLRSAQVRKIVDRIREAKSLIDGIWSSSGNNAEKRNDADEVESRLISDVSKYSLEEKTMYRLLKLLDNKKYSDIRRFLFVVLFQINRGAFYDLVRRSRDQISELNEDDNGEIGIYGFKYSRVLCE